MNTIRVNEYNFDKIIGRMKKEISPIQKGREQAYLGELFSFEASLLIHFYEEEITNQQALDGIKAALFAIQGYFNNVEYDLSDVMDDQVQEICTLLLMCFDPFTNDEIKAEAEKTIDLMERSNLSAIFDVPLKCLIRIANSIEGQIKSGGRTSYFEFLDQMIGHQVKALAE